MNSSTATSSGATAGEPDDIRTLESPRQVALTAASLDGHEEAMSCSPCVIFSMKRDGHKAHAAAASRTIQCEICDLMRPMNMCTNIGTKEYPRYRDRPCNAAAAFYDRALRSQGLVPAESKQNRSKYIGNVFKFRVSHQDDIPEVVEKSVCANKVDRQNHAYVFFELNTHELATALEERVMYGNESEFIGYHMTFCANKRDQAQKLWGASSPAKSGVPCRNNRRGQITLAIELPYEIVKTNKSAVKRGLDKRTAADDENEENSLSKLRTN